MAFMVSRVVVKDREQLRGVSESVRRLKELYGCTYFRLLQAHGDPDTFMAILEFPSMADVYAYAEHLVRMNIIEGAGILDHRQEFYEDPASLDASLSISP